MTKTDSNAQTLDVSVLILFFNRPESLRALFEQVRKARPARLFLYQDGPRGPRDMTALEACRKVVEQIDWPCEVHRKYNEQNSGCDPSNFMAQKWAFSLSDKCIVLEDDDVPSVSFFTFCKEMLDKYENDPRISIISGFNHDEITPDMPYDYFFSTTFSIWGWASWRRVIDTWDEHYTWLDDSFNVQQLTEYIKEHKQRQNFIDFSKYHRTTGKAYYESIYQAAIYFNSGLSIIPRVNLLNNMGAQGEGVHYTGSNATLPKAFRRIFEMKRYELDFPLRHPRYVIENVSYKNRVFRTMGWGHPWLKIARSIEEFWLNLRHGNFGAIAKAMANRFRILTGHSKYD